MKSLNSKSVVKVEDLGITIFPGQTVWVNDEDFESSQCLKALCSMGKVEVVSGGRHRAVRPPNPSRVNRPKNEAPPPRTKVTKNDFQSDLRGNSEDTTRKVAEEAAKMAVNAVIPLIKEIRDTVSTGSIPDDINSRIELAITKAMNNASVVTVSPIGNSVGGRRVVPTQEPVFIPKGIVKEDSETLSINSSSSSNEELDDTVAALKALKQK